MYLASNPPQDPASLPGFLFQELRKLQEAMNGAQAFVTLDTLYVAPTKPREGQIVKADGTSWNPGAGAGFYGYRGGAWRKLD